jgi:hypothetical protein
MKLKIENDIDLCTHMSLAKANLDVAYQLWPTGNLRGMADSLAKAQAELREAEWRLNDILRG